MTTQSELNMIENAPSRAAAHRRIDKMRLGSRVSLLVTIAVCMSACQQDNGLATTGQVAGEQDAIVEPIVDSTTVESMQAVSGKPTAPITMHYEIIGNPTVGVPVNVNVQVSSAAGPVDVSYNIVDRSALSFQQGQVQNLRLPQAENPTVQQLTVVPQREGRLYVNVSASINSAAGQMLRSMSIPIKVGSGPQQATPNGELMEGPDGETVISLPAQEDQ